MPITGKRDIRGAAKIVSARRRLSADLNFHQLLSFRRELVNHRTRGISSPNIPLRIYSNRVRHRVHSLSPLSHDLAVTTHDDDRIGFLATLQKVDQAVFV